MFHLLIIKLNSKEINGVPVTGIPVGSRTVISPFWNSSVRKDDNVPCRSALVALKIMFYFMFQGYFFDLWQLLMQFMIITWITAMETLLTLPSPSQPIGFAPLQLGWVCECKSNIGSGFLDCCYVLTFFNQLLLNFTFFCVFQGHHTV